jgi:hypothetical protein
MTPLDIAHAAMEAAPEEDALRLRFYERLADAELFLLLAEEPDGDRITPQIFDLDHGPTVLVFDREDRLAGFAGGIAAYAALPGRVIVAQLAGQGAALAVNLGAPSAMILPAEVLGWLAETLAHAPTETAARPEAFVPPAGLPEALLTALDAKLARATGLATAALIAGVRYAGGRRGHVLAFVDAAPGAEEPLARAVAEALTFSGIEAGELDVTFLTAGSAPHLAMQAQALRFDLTPPPAPEASTPASPGMDPARPPVLR